MINFPKTEPLLSFKHELRSRYSETDKMGFVYHSKFLEYFEVARVEMIRSYGIDYKAMEDGGIMLPVKDVQLEFRSPVFYDEPIEIEVLVFEEPSIRLKTYYKVSSKNRELYCVFGLVTLFFMRESDKRPCRAPDYFVEHFKSSNN